MTDKEDPEKQVRELWRGETIIYPPRTNPRVVYGEYYATTPIVKDIGRDNLKRRKYQKNKDQSGYFIKYKDK